MSTRRPISERDETATARQRLKAIDDELTAAGGAYWSYPTPHDPVLEEFSGPDPARAIDEILASYATSDTCVLDWGCGAGFALCLLARMAREVWGSDEDGRCIEAAGLRARCEGLGNVTLIHGGAGDEQAVAQLPDDAFHVGLSRRGPNLLPRLLGKLKPDAIWIQEMVKWATGLNEIMGQDKRFFLPHARGDESRIVDFYAGLGFAAVSVHTWFYQQYFRDPDHLAAFLNSAHYLAHRKFDPTRDRDALELYARYNTTDRGIRLSRSRQLAVYRRLGYEPLPADNDPTHGLRTKNRADGGEQVARMRRDRRILRRLEGDEGGRP